MRIQRKEDLVSGLILGGFALLMLHLIVSGTMVLYISAKLIWLSKLAAIVLIGLAIAKFVPIRHRHSHSCCAHGHASSGHLDHTHSTNSLRMMLFLIPLAIGFIMQPRVLGATALSNSINTAGPVPFYAISNSNNICSIFNKSDVSASVQTTASSLLTTPNTVESIPVTDSAVTNNPSATVIKPNSTNKTSSANEPNTPNKTSVSNKVNPQNSLGSQPSPNSTLDKTSQPNTVVQDTDLVQLAFKIYDHPDQAYNHSWRLTGFVYKDPKLGKNEFVITRVVVACCMADAAPMGIIAETPDAASFKPDTWLEIEGILQKRIIQGTDSIKPVSNYLHVEDKSTPYFVITSWKKVSTPKDPYVYP